MHKIILLTIAALLTAACATADEFAAPRQVLFVGNSFTYYNNSLHNHYRALVSNGQSGDESVFARALTISGGRLPEHAAGLRSLLASRDWDAVVLQGHSRGPLDSAEAFRASVAEYAGWVRDKDADVYLFMTWAYTSEPGMTPLLASAYRDAAEAVGARVVPVGIAFANALKRQPQLALITDDDKHPTLAGTYLAACTFLAAMHGVNPVGNVYTAGLNADDARFLQSIAWQSVNVTAP